MKIKHFHGKEKGDYMLGIKGNVKEQTRVKLGMKPLTWGYIHAGIVFPEDLKELMKVCHCMVLHRLQCLCMVMFGFL